MFKIDTVANRINSLEVKRFSGLVTERRHPSGMAEKLPTANADIELTTSLRG